MSKNAHKLVPAGLAYIADNLNGKDNILGLPRGAKSGWAEGLEFDPEEQILMLLEDKYGPGRVCVVEAHQEADCMMLTIETDVWEGQKEFALLKNGSLAW